MDVGMLLHDLFFDYTLRTVALGAMVLGLVSGALGSFAVLRRQSLLGDAMSHAALPGVVIAFMLTGLKNPAVLMAGAACAGIIGVLLMPGPRIAQQWERAVVLRFGRYVGLRGPGLFWIIPFVDRVSSTIDQRTIATGFAAEQTLTADTVPVNVDAVLFWMVHDAEKAALEVQDYGRAVAWAALRTE